MAEASQIVFTHQEVVEALLKRQGINEGVWGLYLRFGLNAANIGPTPDDIVPAAILPVLEIGLQKMDHISKIAVDAAKVNSKGRGTAAKKSR